jgi:chemotaxis protein CheX
MKAEYINPFLESTIHLFTKTFSISPEVSKPYVLTDIGNHRWEISGVMVLTGTAIGVVAVRLTKFLTSKLLEKSGLEFSSDEERNNLITDMVSELVNVVAGNAATKLTDYNIKVSVPFVVQGVNHTISWPERSPIIAIPFLTSFGPFAVYVCIIDQ